MSEDLEGNPVPDASEETTGTPLTEAVSEDAGDGQRGTAPVETAYARGVGSSAGGHHETPPGEGEGTGIGESGG